MGLDLPARGDLALDAFMGHFDFSGRLFGFINRPSLQADQQQSNDSEHRPLLESKRRYITSGAVIGIVVDDASQKSFGFWRFLPFGHRDGQMHRLARNGVLKPHPCLIRI